MKLGSTYIGQARLAVIPRHRKDGPGRPHSLIGCIVMEDIAVDSLHGDVIECEVTITVTHRYRSSTPLGTISSAAMTAANLDTTDGAELDERFQRIANDAE
jgi:hypothetical protein